MTLAEIFGAPEKPRRYSVAKGRQLNSLAASQALRHRDYDNTDWKFRSGYVFGRIN